MKLKLVSGLTATLLSVGAHAAFVNGSFEDTNVSAGLYKYSADISPVPAYAENVTATGWSFVGGSGVASNNSAFSGSASGAGSYYGFLQNVGSISQTFVAASSGPESLTFDLLGRVYNGNNQTVSVSLTSSTGAVLYSSTNTGLSSSVYTSYTSATPITFTAGSSYTLTFAGSATGGDTTAFVDKVALTPLAAVPEPETYAMMLAGLGVMGFVAKRRKAKRD